MNYRALIAGALLYSTGPAAILLMPMIVGVYVDELKFSDRQAGMLAAIEAAGMCAASVLAISWVKKFNWRLVTQCGLALSIVANVGSTEVDTYLPMLALRALASLGAGTAFAASVASLGEHHEPEKAYGIGLGVQTFMMVLMMGVSARIIGFYGIDGLFIMLALLGVLVVLPACWLPSRSKKSVSNDSGISSQAVDTHTWIIVALVATGIHFIGAVGFWAYLERIGHAAGHSTSAIGSILAWSLGAGMLGGLWAAWLGDRWGFARPFLLSTVVLVAAVLLAIGDISLPMLALSAIAFDGMWVFANTYQTALVARLDLAGRYVVLVPAAQGAGAMAGPALAALFVKSGSYMSVNVIATTCFVVSLFMFLFAARAVPALGLDR